jgi:hypothetical protein
MDKLEAVVIPERADSYLEVAVTLRKGICIALIGILDGRNPFESLSH